MAAAKMNVEEEAQISPSNRQPLSIPKNDMVATSSADHQACLFKISGNSIILDKTVLRSSLANRHIVFDPKGRKAAVATE